MSSAPRKPAPRLARPAARYWKGKAPKGADDVLSDSDEEEEVQQPEEEGDVLIGDQDFGEGEDEEGPPIRAVTKPTTTKAINVSLKDVNISKDGKVIVAGREESGRTELEGSGESSEDEDEEKAGEGEEESSEEESSEEEEEEKPKLLFRPKFVPQRARATIAERDAMAQDTEEAIRRKEEEAEERRQQSHNMVADTIKRELLEKEKEAEIPDVDDTDGLEPEAEFEAWRLRELARIKRDKEAEVRRELEREEIERRRALPEEQRLREDMENAKRTRDEKPKGQQKFLQKYWHKGAFHQDAEVLKKHDFTEATESTMDVSMLPQVMQVRNFGKRSRTKYTHLVDQDTTISTGGFGGAKTLQNPGGMPSNPKAGCFNCGGPHMKKDCPQNREGVGSGANNTTMGLRRDGDQGRPKRNWREDDRDGGGGPGRRDDRPRYDGRDSGYRDRRRDDRDDRSEYRRSRQSRSRSPRRSRSRDRDYGGRRRSEERVRDGGHADKRRRTDY
ncbi:microfibrillar-associated protein MFAP1, Zn finger, CCHC type protein [Thelephora terrestris]|uniref:Microfibrillar-associated protein MFAP1, Zn finger, CCHC type protein n=1 Tax=Thelephora terrestris TaxID=56493 RepID=A0A9P6H5P9_9AGAM|nr:microfibrillar-associated protein MFAP1, Zn finger, CCHC type protein [Thelephora terrestris]